MIRGQDKQLKRTNIFVEVRALTETGPPDEGWNSPCAGSVWSCSPQLEGSLESGPHPVSGCFGNVERRQEGNAGQILKCVCFWKEVSVNKLLLFTKVWKTCSFKWRSQKTNPPPTNQQHLAKRKTLTIWQFAILIRDPPPNPRFQ